MSSRVKNIFNRILYFMRNRSISILSVLSVILLAACSVLWFSSSAENRDFVVIAPDPLQGIERTPSKANFVDRSQDATMFIDGIAGESSEDIQIFGGGSKIKGKIVGPENKKREGFVRLARWEGTLYKDIKVPSDKEGNFEVNDVLGGRWSAQSWIPPEFSVGTTQTWFLLQDSTHEMVLDVGRPVKKERSFLVDPEDQTFGFFSLSFVAYDEELGENGEIIERFFEEPVIVSLPTNYIGSNSIRMVNGRGSMIAQCQSFDPIFTTLSRTGTLSLGNENIFFTAPVCVAPPSTTTPDSPIATIPETDTTQPPNSTTTTTTPTSSTIVRPSTTLVSQQEGDKQ